MHATSASRIAAMETGNQNVLYQQLATPEQVNAAIGFPKPLHGLLERGDTTALDAEDFEELVPERLLFADLGG